MNPLGWKREHQIALAGATRLGFAIGIAYAYAKGIPCIFRTGYITPSIRVI
jgi:hypothetical protein